MPGTAHPSALARALRGGRTYPPPRASGDVPAVVRGADVASLVRSTQAPTATGLRGRGVTVTGQLDLSHTRCRSPSRSRSARSRSRCAWTVRICRVSP